MRARGYSLEQIDEIQAAPDAHKGELLAQYLPAKAPTGEARSALVRDVEWLGAQEQAAFDERARAETAATAEALESGIRMTRKGAGWEVREADGTTVTLDSAEAARRIREDLKQAATQREAEALVSIIDRWHDATPEGVSRETVLTGESVRSDGKEITRSRDGAVAREVTSERDLQRLREQARMDARRSGHEEIDVAINGVNWVGRVVRGAREVYQRLEIHRSPNAAMTFLHESVEADWRLGIQSGAITRAETQGAIASVARVFDPAKARDAAERAFRERVQRAAVGEASDTELRETFSELAVADVFGRRRDGTTMPAGSISAALDAAMQAATNPAEVRGLGKLRAFLRTVRTNLRALFGTVAALRKARREGGAQEFDALVSKLFGKDWQATKEWASSQALDGISEVGDAAYSLDKGKSLNSQKKKIPKSTEAMPVFPQRGSFEEVRTRVVAWMKANPTERAPDGKVILIANPEKGSLEARAEHWMASYAIGDTWHRGGRQVQSDKVSSIAAIPSTIRGAQAEARVPGGKTVYLRRYANGALHAVFVDKGNQVTSHGLVNGSVATQFTLDPTKGIEGAIVVQDWTDVAPAPSVNSLPSAEVDRASTPGRQPADQQGSTSTPPAQNYLTKDGDIVNAPPAQD